MVLKNTPIGSSSVGGLDPAAEPGCDPDRLLSTLISKAPATPGAFIISNIPEPPRNPSDTLHHSPLRLDGDTPGRSAHNALSILPGLMSGSGNLGAIHWVY